MSQTGFEILKEQAMSSCPLHRLTAEQVHEFHRNGFLVVEDLLTAQETDALSDHVDRIASGQLPHIPQASIQLEPVFRSGERAITNQVLSVRKLYDIAVYDEQIWAHVTRINIVEIIMDLLGVKDIKMYGDQLFMKAPKTGSAQAWHQDSASWRDIFPMDLVTAWTAIDEATPKNGCLHFIPGTHRWGMLQSNRLQHFSPDFGSQRWPIRPTPLKAGSVSFHHSLALHMSPANQSTQRRRGYAVHYMRATSWKDESVTDAPKMPPFKQICGRSFPGRV